MSFKIFIRFFSVLEVIPVVGQILTPGSLFEQIHNFKHQIYILYALLFWKSLKKFLYNFEPVTIGRGQLDNSTSQISKVLAVQFVTRIFLKI